MFQIGDNLDEVSMNTQFSKHKFQAYCSLVSHELYLKTQIQLRFIPFTVT